MANPYKLYGVVLALAGAILSPVFYFVIGSVPLTSVALSAIMLGFTGIALANARPYLSPGACQSILKSGMENTAALLEEIGIRNKAIYVPSSQADGHRRAIIPLREIDGEVKISGEVPVRLLTRFGPGPEDMAIAVTTTGHINLDLLENIPGPTEDEIEAAITFLLTGVLDIADRVKVDLNQSVINVEVIGPKIGFDNVWYYECLGSPIASIAAAVCSEALGKPIRISKETQNKKKANIILEVLS